MKRKVILSALALLLVVSGASLAKGQFAKIEVFFDKVGLYINGTPSSQTIDAMIYQGTLYVPLRAVGETMGGRVVWDSAERNVGIDFVTSLGDYVVQASNDALYQYIAIEKNHIMNNLIEQLKTRNFEQMKTELERLQKLEDLASDIEDEEMKVLFNKLVFAGEVIRSGLMSNKGKDIKLANDLFLQAEKDLNVYLNNILKRQ